VGQPAPLVRRTRRLKPLTGRELAIGEVSGEAKGTDALPDARRTQLYPYRCLTSTGDSSSSSMADTATLLAVVRSTPSGRAQIEGGEDSRGQGDAKALGIEANGGGRRESHASQEFARV